MKLLYIEDGGDKLYLMDGATPEHHGFTPDRTRAQRVVDDAAEGAAAWLHVPLAVHAEDETPGKGASAPRTTPVRASGVSSLTSPGSLRYARLSDDHPSDRPVSGPA